MPLTNLQVREAAPRERAFKVADGGGLHLLVKPNGAELWRRLRAKAAPDDRPCTRPSARANVWPPKAERSLLSSFGRGLRAHRAAVAAALEAPWSNGQAEGQINR